MPINVISNFVPENDAPFAIVSDTHMSGGLRVVRDIGERDAIPSLRRKTGMLVWVAMEEQTYRLSPDMETWLKEASLEDAIREVATALIEAKEYTDSEIAQLPPIVSSVTKSNGEQLFNVDNKNPAHPVLSSAQILKDAVATIPKAEMSANKTSVIDAPDATKYPSTGAVINYVTASVRNAMNSLPRIVSSVTSYDSLVSVDNTDPLNPVILSTTALQDIASKAKTAEQKTNKVSAIGDTQSVIQYPSVKALTDYVSTSVKERFDALPNIVSTVSAADGEALIQVNSTNKNAPVISSTTALKNAVSLIDKAELSANKVTKIDDAASNSAYPSSLAVYTFSKGYTDKRVNELNDTVEHTAFKVSSIDKDSTNGQYPSAKAVADFVQSYTADRIAELPKIVSGIVADEILISANNLNPSSPIIESTPELQEAVSLANKAEQPANKVTVIDENATDEQYPSAASVRRLAVSLDSNAQHYADTAQTSAEQYAENIVAELPPIVSGIEPHDEMIDVDNSDASHPTLGASDLLVNAVNLANSAEQTDNKVIAITDKATNNQYPTAEATYNFVASSVNEAKNASSAYTDNAISYLTQNGMVETIASRNDETLLDVDNKDPKNPVLSTSEDLRTAVARAIASDFFERQSNRWPSVTGKVEHANKYPTVKAVHDYVQQSLGMVIESQSLSIPGELDLESKLPLAGTHGDYYFIQNMDIMAPGHTGVAWWNEKVSSTAWLKIVDQYGYPDNVSLIMNPQGSLQVSPEWLAETLDPYIQDNGTPLRSHLNLAGNTIISLGAPTKDGDAVNKLYADTKSSDTVKAHADLTTAHGAVSAPTADRIVVRDKDGRAQFADPVLDGDAATKSYVDTISYISFASADEAALQASKDKVVAPAALTGYTLKITFDAHVNSMTAHGATFDASPDRIMLRNSAGRVQVADPAADADAATKRYSDKLGSSMSTANTIMRRDAQGRTQVATPDAALDAANKDYVDSAITVKSTELATAIGSVISNLTDYAKAGDLSAHIKATAAHGASSTPTKYTIAAYDGSAKLYSTTPVDTDPTSTVATKGYIDNNLKATIDNLEWASAEQALEQAAGNLIVRPQSLFGYAKNDDLAAHLKATGVDKVHGGTFFTKEAPSNADNNIAVRYQGRLQSAEPVNIFDVATKGYSDKSLDEHSKLRGVSAHGASDTPVANQLVSYTAAAKLTSATATLEDSNDTVINREYAYKYLQSKFVDVKDAPEWATMDDAVNPDKEVYKPLRPIHLSAYLKNTTLALHAQNLGENAHGGSYFVPHDDWYYDDTKPGKKDVTNIEQDNNLVVRLDGRIQAAAPVNGFDVTTKSFVDNLFTAYIPNLRRPDTWASSEEALAQELGTVIINPQSLSGYAKGQDLSDHISKSGADGVHNSTSTPTANMIAAYDGNSRLHSATPVSGNDVATWSWVQNTAGSSSATNNSLARRDASSKLYAATPTSADGKDAVVTQGLLNSSISSITSILSSYVTKSDFSSTLSDYATMSYVSGAVSSAVSSAMGSISIPSVPNCVVGISVG